VLCGLLSVLVIVKMERTEESVIEFIELYKRNEIKWDPKYPIHFNTIRNQDAWEELGEEMNRPVDECVSAPFLNRNGFPEGCGFFEIFLQLN